MRRSVTEASLEVLGTPTEVSLPSKSGMIGMTHCSVKSGLAGPLLTSSQTVLGLAGFSWRACLLRDSSGAADPSAILWSYLATVGAVRTWEGTLSCSEAVLTPGPDKQNVGIAGFFLFFVFSPLVGICFHFSVVGSQVFATFLLFHGCWRSEFRSLRLCSEHCTYLAISSAS